MPKTQYQWQQRIIKYPYRIGRGAAQRPRSTSDTRAGTTRVLLVPNSVEEKLPLLQGMRFSVGSGRQGRYCCGRQGRYMYCCNVICDDLMTSKVKGLRWDENPYNFCDFFMKLHKHIFWHKSVIFMQYLDSIAHVHSVGKNCGLICKLTTCPKPVFDVCGRIEIRAITLKWSTIE